MKKKINEVWEGIWEDGEVKEGKRNAEDWERLEEGKVRECEGWENGEERGGGGKKADEALWREGVTWLNNKGKGPTKTKVRE